MDHSKLKTSSDSQTAPIVLSPPPLDHAKPLNQSEFPSQRQQSVGYNLQHEFETLTAELDLDLKNQTRASQSAPPITKERGPSGSNLIAPSASKYAGVSSNLLNIGSQEIPTLHATQTGRVQSSQPTGGFLQPPSIPDRPQSAHDFANIFRRPGLNQVPQSNLYLDLLVFSNWIENLSPQDTVSMIDYLCASLPVDVLLTFQAKLDQHLQVYNQPLQNPLSPYGNNPDLDIENLSLNEFNQPQRANTFNPLNLDMVARPRSADPFLQKNQGVAGFRSKSPTSHLHEKTNFLQLAASNAQTHFNQPFYSNGAGQGLHQDEKP